MTDHPDLFSGESLKAEGTALVAEHNEAWMNSVLIVIARIASWGNSFTIEDVRRYCKSWLDEPSSPNAWGAAFSAAAKQGLIVRVGYQKNRLASAHSRVVATWKGKQ